MESDWNDIGTVVDHLRALRRVDKVSIVGWSQGGPRGGGYAARNPAKVARLVMLAPAYTRASPPEAPNPLPPSSGPMTARSEEHTSELQSQSNLVCRLLLEKKKTPIRDTH